MVIPSCLFRRYVVSNSGGYLSKELAQTVGCKWLIGLLLGLLAVFLAVVFLGQTRASVLPLSPNSTAIQSVSMPVEAGVLPAVTVENVAVADVSGSSMDANVTTDKTYNPGAANAPDALVGNSLLIDSAVHVSTNILLSVVDSARIHGFIAGSHTNFGISAILIAVLVLIMAFAVSDILSFACGPRAVHRGRQSTLKPQGGIYKRAQAPMLRCVPFEVTT